MGFKVFFLFFLFYESFSRSNCEISELTFQTIGTVKPGTGGTRVRRFCISTTLYRPIRCFSRVFWWSGRYRPTGGTRPAVCLSRLRRHIPKSSNPICSCTASSNVSRYDIKYIIIITTLRRKKRPRTYPPMKTRKCINNSDERRREWYVFRARLFAIL